MSQVGRDLVAWLEKGLREVERWEPFMAKLTPWEAGAIAAGTLERINRPLEPEWPVGVEVKVRANLWIAPHSPVKARKGYAVSFDVKDFRPRLLRRVPSMYDAPEMDTYGEPIPPTLDAIERARQTGSYTSSSALAVPDAGEAVDEETQRRFTKDAAERWLRQPGRREDELRRRARTLANRLRAAVISKGPIDEATFEELDLIEQHIALLERQRHAA